MLRVLLVAMLGCVAFPAIGKDTEAQIPVYLNAQCANDTVGQRIAYNIRERLRQSSSMKNVDSLDSSEISVSFLCASPDESVSGHLSTYAYAVKVANFKGPYDYHISLRSGRCGTNRVEECAELVVSDIDSDIVEVVRRMADGSFKPFAP